MRSVNWLSFTKYISIALKPVRAKTLRMQKKGSGWFCIRRCHSLDFTVVVPKELTHCRCFPSTFACYFVWLQLAVCLDSRLQCEAALNLHVLCDHDSLGRFSGPVRVCAVQTLRCCRVPQRHGQLSSSFPPGETLRGTPQKGHPPPTGGLTET